MFDRDLSHWFGEVRRDGNPYLTEWFAVAVRSEALDRLFITDRQAWERELTRSLEDGTTEHEVRRTLAARYAWAIPCEAALSTLSQHAPLVEAGSGTGYWASLLRNRGVDIIAYDRDPPPDEKNHWHGRNEPWTTVLPGGPEVLAAHADRTLFLCWPPYSDRFAVDCLDHYAGSTLIFVGEHGGCTGDERFFALLERDWEEVHEVQIPQFDGLHDVLIVYKRKVGIK